MTKDQSRPLLCVRSVRLFLNSLKTKMLMPNTLIPTRVGTRRSLASCGINPLPTQHRVQLQVCLHSLKRTRQTQLISAPPNHDLSDEVVCVEGPDIRDVQREALQKARITDNVKKWADTFANADVDTLVQNIAFITDRYQAILPQYLIALRAVSQSIPSPEAGIVHLRNYLLEAIGKGWTLNNSNMTVNGQQFGLEEAILAVASYHCRTVITESEETLFSTVTRVASNISMEDQETLFDGIKVQCLACSKEEEISAFTHCTTISVEMIVQCSAAELFHGVEPIFDAAGYFANTPHDPSCRIAQQFEEIAIRRR